MVRYDSCIWAVCCKCCSSCVRSRYSCFCPWTISPLCFSSSFKDRRQWVISDSCWRSTTTSPSNCLCFESSSLVKVRSSTDTVTGGLIFALFGDLPPYSSPGKEEQNEEELGEVISSGDDVRLGEDCFLDSFSEIQGSEVTFNLQYPFCLNFSMPDSNRFFEWESMSWICLCQLSLFFLLRQSLSQWESMKL